MRAVNGPKRHVLAGLAEEGLEIASRLNTSPEHPQSLISAEEGYAPKEMWGDSLWTATSAEDVREFPIFLNDLQALPLNALSPSLD